MGRITVSKEIACLAALAAAEVFEIDGDEPAIETGEGALTFSRASS